LRSTLDTPNGSDALAVAAREAPLPRRWTLHGLNNGLIFNATWHGVVRLPRPVSYAIGYAGTYLAWRAMAETRRALAANLAAIFPGETAQQLERRALATFRSYARDTIDFLRALEGPIDQAAAMFELRPETLDTFTRLQAERRGALLVTGHFGNWEIGSVLVTAALDAKLTIVASARRRSRSGSRWARRFRSASVSPTTRWWRC
jgi:lauroyl/myristoyl acyltransferase